jgi:hypothetical protein
MKLEKFVEEYIKRENEKTRCFQKQRIDYILRQQRIRIVPAHKYPHWFYTALMVEWIKRNKSR